MQILQNKKYPEKRRRSRRRNGILPSFLVVFFLCVLLIVGLVRLLSPEDEHQAETPDLPTLPSNQSGVRVQPNETAQIFPAEESKPDPTDRQAAQNAVLLGLPATGTLEADVSVTRQIPKDITVTQTIYSGMKKAPSFSLSPPIIFSDPLNAQSVPGILSFRGTSYRNAPSWGLSDILDEKLVQRWEFQGIGEKLSGDGVFSWKGTGWTGQPLIVEWPAEVMRWMDLFPEKKEKNILREVIVAALDGNIYFFDLDDGAQTRLPIYVGATVKGTPTVDPRGYPLLYLGQGDENADDSTAGFWIYSLIDGQRLFFQDGYDSRSHRPSWGCADASPLICASSDTLLYPCENGLLYIYPLHTLFDANTGALSVSPESDPYVYNYLVSDQSGASVGIESSIAVYNHYAYWADNHGNLLCLDLEKMQILWMIKLGDLSDVTPVIEEEGQSVSLYIGTRVEIQRTDTQSYIGASYTYKVDALSGEIIWQTSIPAYVEEDSDAGGVFGTPIVGKLEISGLVIFPYCRTVSAQEGSRLVAFDKKTGEKVWNYDMSAISWSSPVDCYRNGDEKAYIIMTDSLGQIHLVDGARGTRLDYLQLISKKGTEEETRSGLTIESSAAAFEGRIVVGTRSGSVFAADLT